MAGAEWRARSCPSCGLWGSLMTGCFFIFRLVRYFICTMIHMLFVSYILLIHIPPPPLHINSTYGASFRL